MARNQKVKVPKRKRKTWQEKEEEDEEDCEIFEGEVTEDTEKSWVGEEGRRGTGGGGYRELEERGWIGKEVGGGKWGMRNRMVAQEVRGGGGHRSNGKGWKRTS